MSTIKKGLDSIVNEMREGIEEVFSLLGRAYDKIKELEDQVSDLEDTNGSRDPGNLSQFGQVICDINYGEGFTDERPVDVAERLNAALQNAEPSEPSADEEDVEELSLSEQVARKMEALRGMPDCVAEAAQAIRKIDSSADIPARTKILATVSSMYWKLKRGSYPLFEQSLNRRILEVLTPVVVSLIEACATGEGDRAEIGEAMEATGWLVLEGLIARVELPPTAAQRFEQFGPFDSERKAKPFMDELTFDVEKALTDEGLSLTAKAMAFLVDNHPQDVETDSLKMVMEDLNECRLHGRIGQRVAVQAQEVALELLERYCCQQKVIRQIFKDKDFQNLREAAQEANACIPATRAHWAALETLVAQNRLPVETTLLMDKQGRDLVANAPEGQRAKALLDGLRQSTDRLNPKHHKEVDTAESDTAPEAAPVELIETADQAAKKRRKANLERRQQENRERANRGGKKKK